MAKEDEIAGLSPDQPFADAGRIIIAHRFAAMWVHREGTLAGDEEALHDMRVGSRRLRAALDVFAATFHGGEFRRLHRLTARLTDELGGVRDHDVMLLSLQRYRKGVPRDERAGIDDLMGPLAAERAVARRRLQRFFARLDGADYAARMHHLAPQEAADG
jgi:CHAD domain-containing protein